MGKEKFHSVITNNILIPRETAISYSQEGRYVEDECCFRNMNGEHGGLYEVNLNGYLICALEKASIEVIAQSIPELMKVSLFKVLKYWFKAWF